MKRIIALIMCVVLLTACGGTGDENIDNNDTQAGSGNETTVSTEQDSESSDEQESTDPNQDGETTVEETNISVKDEESVMAFLENSYFATVDYDVSQYDVMMTHADVTFDGEDDAVVQFGEYYAVFVTVVDGDYKLIGVADLGKYSDSMTIEDGFVVFRVAYTGTGTATYLDRVMRYNGSKMVTVGDIIMAGHEAAYDEVYEGIKTDGYMAFEYTYNVLNSSDENVKSTEKQVYEFNEESFSYDITPIIESNESNDDVISFNNMAPGDVIDGFTVEKISNENGEAGIQLTGSLTISGTLTITEDELFGTMYSIELENQLFSKDFVAFMEDDYDSFEWTLNAASLRQYVYQSYTVADQLDGHDGETITCDIIGYAGAAKLGTEGIIPGVIIDNISFENDSMSENGDDINNVQVGQEFGTMTVSRVGFDGDELSIELEGDEVITGTIGYAIGGYDDYYYVESDQLDDLIDMSISYTLNSGFSDYITGNTNMLYGVEDYLSTSEIAYLKAGNTLEVELRIVGYEEFIKDMSEGGSSWFVGGVKSYEDVPEVVDMSIFTNETITTDSGDVTINYKEFGLVLIPEHETVNSEKLTPYPVELGTTGFYRLAVMGAWKDVKVTLYTSMDDDGTTIDVGDISNVYLAILADLPNDMSTVKVSGTYVEQNGTESELSVGFDDMRDPSAYDIITMK